MFLLLLFHWVYGYHTTVSDDFQQKIKFSFHFFVYFLLFLPVVRQTKKLPLFLKKSSSFVNYFHNL